MPLLTDSDISNLNFERIDLDHRIVDLLEGTQRIFYDGDSDAYRPFDMVFLTVYDAITTDPLTLDKSSTGNYRVAPKFCCDFKTWNQTYFGPNAYEEQ